MSVSYTTRFSFLLLAAGEGGPCPPPHTGLARWLCSPEEVVELVLARSFHCRACNGLWLHAVKEPPAFFLHILRELIVLDRRATYWTRRGRSRGLHRPTRNHRGLG